MLFRSDFDVVKDLKDRFRARIRVAPEITVCAANNLQEVIMPDISRKPVKFIDKRSVRHCGLVPASARHCGLDPASARHCGLDPASARHCGLDPQSPKYDNLNALPI